MKLSSREKLAVTINVLLSLIIAIKYTLKISLENIRPNFDMWFTLAILHLFTTFLFGTPLFCLSHAICFNQKRSVNSEQFVTASAFVSIGIATAYTMMLYLFGLTDDFFSFIFS